RPAFRTMPGHKRVAAVAPLDKGHRARSRSGRSDTDLLDPDGDGILLRVWEQAGKLLPNWER
ncbi:MAG: hypothetical protein P8Y37_00775, partial [Anaerolineales bacterium]